MRSIAAAGAALALATSAAAMAQTPAAQVPSNPPGIIGAPAGTGPMLAVAELRADFDTHTLFHPAKLPRRAMPLVVWGNGGCRDNGLSHGAFLREIASHGYFVVAAGRPRAERGIEPRVAPNPNAPPPGPDETQASQLTEAIDWAAREAVRPGSPFKGRIDTAKIAVMGHSCGGLQAIAVSADPRVSTSVIFNSGVYNAPPIGKQFRIGKEALALIHAPIAYFLGGPTDIAHANGSDDVARINQVPVFFGELPVGHGGTFWAEPNGGEWARVAALWLDWQLKGDKTAAKAFAGPACGLCTDARWTVIRKGLD